MKRVISLLITLIMTLSVISVSMFTAYTKPAEPIHYETSGDFEYKLLDDGTVNVVGYLGSDVTVDIPRKLDAGYVVTGFIGRTFDNSETVKSITIPDTVTRVYGSCSTVSEIKVDKNNKVYDSRDNCNAIIETETNTLVTGCMNTTIPDSVTVIADSAFANCIDITTITIPDSVTDIEQRAFKDCTGLTTITIPESVNNISSFRGGAFEGCENLSQIIVDENNKVYDSRENCNAIIETKTNTLVYGCLSTVIPNDVASISDYAFWSCEGLISITIPHSVTSIGEWAFAYCKNLISVVIQDGVKNIAENAFMYCEGLTSITISDTVIDIGENAFGSCDNLSTITIPSSVTNIGESAFSSCDNLSSVTITEGVTSIGNYAFSYCMLTSLTIPKSVKSIGDYAFDEDVKLYVYSDSYAYEYAKSNGYEFIVIDDNENVKEVETESDKKSMDVSATVLIIVLCVSVPIILAILVVCVLILTKKRH